MRLRGGLHAKEPQRPKRGRLGKPEKPIGERHENRAQRKMSRFAVRKQPGSGNQPGKKGDLDVSRPESLLAECKTTEKVILEVEIDWLRKIDREARGVRKSPMIIMGFEAMGPPCERDWGALPLPLLMDLIEAAGWDLEVKSGA